MTGTNPEDVLITCAFLEWATQQMEVEVREAARTAVAAHIARTGALLADARAQAEAVPGLLAEVGLAGDRGYIATGAVDRAVMEATARLSQARSSARRYARAAARLGRLEARIAGNQGDEGKKHE